MVTYAENVDIINEDMEIKMYIESSFYDNCVQAIYTENMDIKT